MIHSTLSITKDKNLYEKYWEIMAEIWPKVVMASGALKRSWEKVERYFPATQLLALSEEKEIIGFISAIPFHWEQELNELPEEGWDWLFQKAIEDYEMGIAPNCLGGLQIGIAKKYQGQGYSKELIKIGKELLIRHKLNYFIIPIRPTLKHKYPLTEMAEYINWKKENKPFDPWIRIHTDCGATIVKICSRSMTIRGTKEEWEDWSGLEIKESGSYIIPGALSAVQIDLDEKHSSYYEDNIWIYYTGDA